MSDKLSPADLIRLLLEAGPHAELIQRSVTHWGQLEVVLSAPQFWPELRGNLLAAKKAPEHLRAAFHRAVFDDFAKKHGQDAAFWGALALEMGKEKTPAAGKKSGRPGLTDQERAERLAVLDSITEAVQNDQRPTADLAAVLNADPHLISRLRSGLETRQIRAGKTGRIGLDRLRAWQQQLQR